MNELAERIRATLLRDYGDGDWPAAQAVSDVLDKCDHIEGNPGDVFTWDGSFIATVFRATIAGTLGVSTSDSPAGSAGVLVSAGDPSSPPRGPTDNTVGSQPRGGELEASIARGLAEYAAAYFIPANALFIGRRKEVAKTWGELAAPYIADCIREDRRRGGEPDWHRIAIQVARYGGSYHGLSTEERDRLEDEVRLADTRDGVVG